MTISKGSYRGRGLAAALGKTKNGKDQVAVQLEALDDGFAGETITWYGYFGEASVERTLESLRILGWKTDDLDNLDGITENEVRFVVDEEEYEGKTYPKVKWINKLGGGLALHAPMTGGEAKSFAQRMKGQVLAQKQKSGMPVAAPPRGNGSAGRKPNAPPPESQMREPGDDEDIF